MRKFSTLFVAFLLVSPILWGQIYLQENFNGTSGTTPPTGWQNVVNAGGNVAQPWEFSSISGGVTGGGFDQEYAILNSDAYGSGNTQNVSLISPSFSTIGSAYVRIVFSEQFRAIGTSSGTLAVSDDGGTNWTDILVRTGASVGYPNPAVTTTILVPEAVNQANVQFRWTYVGTWGFWWAIDNVVVQETAAPAPLIGGNIYPINNVSNAPTQFANITEASNYLSIEGVAGTGQVIFELGSNYDSSTEPGPITIGPISGTSPTLGVTFRPATGVTALTSIAGGATPNQHAINIAGTSYITLDGRAGGAGSSRDWTIRVTGTTNAQMAVRLNNSGGPMTGVSIRNLIMEGEATGTTGAIFQITGVSGNTISDVIIENNLIQSGAALRGYGMTLAVANNVGNTGIIVRNNNITRFATRGINITGGFPGLEVYGNSIYHTEATTGASEFAGIYFSTSNSPGAKIYNNYIYNIQITSGSTTSITGIQVLVANGSGDPVTWFNNRIDIGSGIEMTTIPVYGIHHSSTVNTYLHDFYYNSVRISGTATAGSANSAAFRKAGGNFMNIKNNIFYNSRSNDGGTGTHWAIAVNNTTFASIGYNDYYADGSDGVLGTTTNAIAGNVATLPAWQAAVPIDFASVSQNPNFVADLKVNTSIPTQLESGAEVIAGVTQDFEGTPRYPNVGYPEKSGFPPSSPDIGAFEFGGEPIDLIPPVISYTPLSNTSTLGARNLIANITDGSGVPISGIGLPVLYWRVQDVPANPYVGATAIHVGGNDYSFSFGGSASFGDVIEYYIAAQDLNSPPNVAVSPSTGAGGFSVNPPAASTPPSNPSSYVIVSTPLSGDYTVGVSLFNKSAGTELEFVKRSRTVEEVMTLNEFYLNPEKWEVASPEVRISEDGTVITDQIDDPGIPADLEIVVTYEQTYYVPFENGVEYTGSLFHQLDKAGQEPGGRDEPEGVYATITAALADAALRGVSGPVRFLLTDADYPSETFPIVLQPVTGISSTNTITILPDVGVTSLITFAHNFPIVQFIGASHYIIDGRQNGVSNPGSLTITNTNNTASAHVIQFVDGSTNNIVQYASLSNAGAGTGGNALVHLTTSVNNPSGNSNNLIKGNILIGGRSGVLSSGTAANPNINNMIEDNKVSEFGFAGVWLSANTINTTIRDNEIFNTTTGINVAHSGINASSTTVGGINEISGNKIYDLQNTASTTIRGITMSGATDSEWNIFNNFISLTNDNGTKTSIYAIQNSGTTNVTLNMYYNTFRLGGTHTGGTANVVVSCGYVNSNTSASVTIRYKNNISLNTRSGGTAGVFHVGTWFINVVGTMDCDYNTHWAFGGNSFHAGWTTTIYNDLAAYKAAATPNEQNSIFKATNFVSDVDLHLAGVSIGDFDLAGTPIIGITTDIDGDSRNATYPYRGADEAGVPLIPPTCAAPFDLYVENITIDGADLGWTVGGSELLWNIEVGEPAFVPGTGNAVKSEYGTGDNPYAVKELTPGTAYEFYIQADCGDGDVSNWVGPIAFTTLCEFACPSGAIAESEACSSNTNGGCNMGTPAFEPINAGDIICGTLWAEGGSRDTDWFELVLTGPSYVILHAYSERQMVFGKIGGIDPLNPLCAQVTGISPFALTDLCTPVTLNLGALTAGTYWFFTGLPSPYTGNPCSINYWIEFEVIEITCPQPTALTATNITTNSADLGWTAGGSETMWNIEWGVSGFTLGSGNQIFGVTANPYTLGGLTSGVQYDFYVQADCGSEARESSTWAGPYTFKTVTLGQTCNVPIVISSVPFTDTDNTSNFGDDYSDADRPALGGEQYTNGTGAANYLTGDDVVYSITPATDGIYNFGLTDIDTWVGFWLFEGCNPFTSIVAYHTSTAAGTRSLPGINLTGGTTYYIVISTWASPQSTPYTLTVEEVLPSIPDNLSLTDPITGAECFNANETITINGATVENGAAADIRSGGTITATNFEVKSGGSALLKAETSITLNDNVLITPGAAGYFHATIVVFEPCVLPLAMIASEEVVIPEVLPEITSTESFFKVFPNPTTGSFKLELTGVEESSSIFVEIFGMMGERVFQDQLFGSMLYEFDLSNMPKGIYFIRVLKGDEMGIEKVIKQ